MNVQPTDKRRTALITGAGSGIGAATARRMAAEGYRVFLTGRRVDRIESVARQIIADGGLAEARFIDVTDERSVAAVVDDLDRCDVLVNNAGGAIGTESVADANSADWRTMYETNVLGTLHVTRELLPKLAASGDGTVVVVSSTAAFTVYEGGGGYSAAKHGEHVLAATLRLELCGEPIRVIEIAPGMVHTEEFSLNRYRGDREKAAAVYAGVEGPLVADDIADAIAWAVTRPSNVNIDFLVIKPRAQAAQHKVYRRG
ncbi:SDR family NAD(P)-dependent oxidoreductase [Streptomyces verrucosisporus]|uniref:SDR family NAD(P)-dependent oxidoreductase n=1 Tax=Streptomyces verrucosisporus TaxID=1695161 RepID=UPI0019D077E9|nr:SDR family NAD(P)-dependent oxidoreductase [Streptomyces verrucosisporus]MBN3933137.1 SDR family NAD(P)-dependent oxidoreductase [Streptomyces verrucosisporus]